LVADTELRRHTERTRSRLWDQQTFFIGWRIALIIVMLRRVRIRTLDLYEALGADRLVTAASLVEVWRVVHEADRTLCSVLVQNSLKRRAVDSRISW
jgi:hypothetical protein